MLAVRALSKQLVVGSSKSAAAATASLRVGGGAVSATSYGRSLSSVAQLQALTAENPYTDVVHYTHKNRTWSMQHVDYYSTALAIGLAENGLTVGDKVLSWLPQHFAEQVRA
jgi:hypothetical protein